MIQPCDSSISLAFFFWVATTEAFSPHVLHVISYVHFHSTNNFLFPVILFILLLVDPYSVDDAFIHPSSHPFC